MPNNRGRYLLSTSVSTVEKSVYVLAYKNLPARTSVKVTSEARTSLYCRETDMILDCIDRTVALQII